MNRRQAQKFSRRTRADAAEPTREEQAEQALALALADCPAAARWDDAQWEYVVTGFLELSTREQGLVVGTARLLTGQAQPTKATVCP